MATNTFLNNWEVINFVLRIWYCGLRIADLVLRIADLLFAVAD
jgi:hypothetical protein